MGPMSPFGTGGVPNLRIVVDYAPITGPEAWFEIHTQIRIPDGTADQIRGALASRDLPTAIALVLSAGVIDPQVPRPAIVALLNALYFVP